MKVISFSLWGNNPKYTFGAIRNAELAALIYPGWECWFFVDKQARADVGEVLEQMPNVRLWHILHDDWRGMFDRFFPITFDNADRVDVMLSRDCDSRLSLREKAAVDEWLASDKTFHIMRDHPWHGSQILGGMWGCKQGFLPSFSKLMACWNMEDRWQTDQDFLNAVVYPRVVHNAMIHASFLRMEPHARDFPTPRNGIEFVGQVFDENDNTVAEHLAALAKAL